MQLTQYEALRAYASTLNTLDISHIEPLLDDNFIYESQKVFTPLESKQAFLDYMIPKLETIRNSGATVFAEMGMISAYGEYQPCVVFAQYRPENLAGIALAKLSGNRISRIDLCITPPPELAERSGYYPA